ncbi:hypothetical protein LPB142_02720 [Rhodobacter xanthinilyticus]|uniref:Uncharacterized protein n=1 Tax=Rhodobacter xanthinilyticus TaxID=1850250 RepID=A0A1D9M985_9RHOB|nr:hypothetical protein [Rhodobacter xanthinilyticus]AOZ68360.1 hypothetical protein LPB142_02720 [Rhodobacter xanthinilyticus]
MLIKGMTLFLVVMAVLAMFGKLRLPGGRGGRRAIGRVCPACGRPKIGAGPCPCGKSRES